VTLTLSTVNTVNILEAFW